MAPYKTSSLSSSTVANTSSASAKPNNPATTVRPKTKKGKVAIILGIVIGVIAFVVIAIAAGIMSNRMRGSANLEVDVSTQEMTGVQAENDFSETNPVKIED